jgi:hydrogenase nickel incorporation protein HypB
MMNIITVERSILAKNDEVARMNREMFRNSGLFVANLVSSPGAGKTSLLERTLEYFRGSVPIGVIEGDLQTDLDSQRVARYGVPTVQIMTRGGCHLEANLIRDAIGKIDLSNLRLLFIENVGNLVCPANYDLGESVKIVIASTTEGDDKPLKYPAMFLNASAMVINKTDLLPYVSSDINVLRANALRINPQLTVFETSCVKNTGIEEWCSWLKRQIIPAS